MANTARTISDGARPSRGPIEQGSPRSPSAAGSDPAPAATATPARNPRFDALRGLAIALMVLDHVAMILWKLQIDSEVRSVTRLAEPLFVLLFGYLLYGRPRARLGTRGLQLLAAALVSNALFYPAYHSLDILVTFLGVLLIFAALGNRLMVLVPLVVLLPWDPTRSILDYPLFMVLGQAAFGMALHHRQGAWWGAWAGAAVLGAAALLLDGPHRLEVVLTGLAALALLAARRWPGQALPGLDFIGRHPLSIYALQFPVIFGLGIGLGAPAVARIATWYAHLF
ncbi:MAG: TraX family protein [Myxococcota bacterium]|nr:TraX family protein [Myxococcota bacterium]